MVSIKQSNKLQHVCYDIRGPVLKEAKRLEEEGHRVLKLNIGNPAPFGFEAPDDILKDVIRNLPTAQGYCDSKGIYSARVAIMQYYQQKNITGVDIEDIYVGNGVSELILMAMNGLLNQSDEVLLPSPDYPLWTASVALSGGKPVHYICDETNEWNPDVADIEAKITDKTKAIVIINPNNPTGAVYSDDVLKQIINLARKHNLIIFSDEIYDKVLYDKTTHTPTASLADDVFIVTFSGLSKNYRIAGFRAGWMMLSGNKAIAESYIEGLDMLASMRLCANVPCQHAIQTALGGFQSINQLIEPGGRLYEQTMFAWQRINQIDGVTCVKPKGAMYLFPKLDQDKFNIKDDEKFILDFLRQEKILMVHGTGFNWHQPDHFRVVTLPHIEILTEALDKLERFLSRYRQQ
ncbi:pyridoxal phosphate-dependent aminotransferase [Catenovulum adriaticum]|uniref:alanine transaminase n=1 Tax=Catenovulum adriaticum TaxID=2984846 RepID=A0ABY7ANV8_9ALTE|nr:pyridoxal phosphate-dependent aminotransferase [Catenovulum sp. TS8]WAJ70995.1 pyridoxal phosphate-dependent aminotransferase [Catenovulum sp. TS8]